MILKNKLLTIKLTLLVLFTFNSYSQKEANFWYFGFRAGLDFSSGVPVSISTGKTNESEGTACQSDANGNLLFYTDGDTVWNKNHLVMTNGRGLTGTSSSTQSALIIKRPGSTNIYYVFTAPVSGSGGISYSIVDMTMSGGLGAVTTKNASMTVKSGEKIVGVPHCNGLDYWIVTREIGTNAFQTFLLTSTGLNLTPVVTNIGVVLNANCFIGCGIGQLKVSPNGRKIASATWDYPISVFELFDFDNSTGVLSNLITFPQTNPWQYGAYGVEFSPDGTKLYGSDITSTLVVQYNLCAGSNAAIANSGVTIFTGTGSNKPGCLQLGPDGKIYVAREGQNYISVINNPNVLGTGCNFVSNGVAISGRSELGLPNFVVGPFIKQTLQISSSINCLDVSFTAPFVNTFSCAGSSVTSLSWNFDDPSSGTSNTSIQNSPIHTFSAPGTYTITTIAYRSCTNDTIRTPITVASCSCSINASLVLQNNVYCSGGTNGSAAISLSGGSGGTYTYSWNNGTTNGSVNTSASTYTITSLTAGVYTVTTLDGSCTATSTISITEPSAISFGSPTITNASCGSNNGAAVISASGGNNSSYNYTWSNTATGNSTTNLSAATYSVTVTDGNACTQSTTVNISNSPAPTINNLAPTNPLCFGDNNGSVSVNATGTGTLSYNWSNGNTGITASNLTTGTHQITVTDGNGCKTIQNITLTNPALITPGTTNVSNASCGLPNGSAIANATGGTGSLTFTWSNGQSGQTIINQSSGAYTFTVTDANNCSKTSGVNILNLGGASFSTSTISNANCNGASGSATVTISGGLSGNYTYVWSNGVTNITSASSNQQPLTSNSYTVTVIDGSCSSTTAVNITEPSSLSFASSTINDASCGLSDGSANVTASGGTGSLNYSWSNGTTGQTISLINSGNYVVTVTDANSCTNTTSVLINNNPSATINSVTTTTLTCSNSGDGASVVSASGGTGTLTYSWSNGTSGATIAGVSAGTYVISVTDASGCLTQSSVIISQPSAISLLSADAVSSSCGNNNGLANITVTGGGGVYSYNWSNGASGVTSIGNLSPNTYFATVTDQNSCTYVHTFNIGNRPSPVFTGSSPIISPADCKGNATGEIFVIINSGTGPYTYSWSTGASSVNNLTTNNISSLSAGNYALTITDFYGCSIDTSLVLTEPSFILTNTVTTIDPTCSVQGSATVSISGGNSGSYNYSWSNGTNSSSTSTSNTISSLSANNYSVTATDSKGCTTIGNFTINNPPGAPTVQGTLVNNVSCNGFNDGSATVTISGTSGTYTYTWSNGTTSVTSALSSQSSNLTSQTYTVTVTDNNGCTTTTQVAISQPSIFSVTTTATNTTCGNTNGVVITNVSGGNAGLYIYTWSNGATNSAINNLAPSTYSVTATDSKGCTSTSNAIVNITPLPTASASASATTITEGSSTTLSASGGVSYLWSPSGNLSCSICQSPVANPTTNTTYTVIVTDANTCKDTAFISIEVEKLLPCGDNFLPTAFSPNGDGINDVIYVRGNGLSNIELKIFNRWGELVFETFDTKLGWNGMYNNEPCEVGVFVYYLNATCNTLQEKISIQGNITLTK